MLLCDACAGGFDSPVLNLDRFAIMRLLSSEFPSSRVSPADAVRLLPPVAAVDKRPASFGWMRALEPAVDGGVGSLAEVGVDGAGTLLLVCWLSRSSR